LGFIARKRITDAAPWWKGPSSSTTSSFSKKRISRAAKSEFRVLKDEGVQVVGKMEEYPYGKFGWIMDPDGNKIELWEPVDEEAL